MPIPISERPSSESSSITNKTVFTIVNNTYTDAAVSISVAWNETEQKNYYTMTLFFDGQGHDFTLATSQPTSSPPYAPIVNQNFNGIEDLFNSINSYGNGWSAGDFQSRASLYRLTELKTFGSTACYNSAVNVETNSISAEELSQSSGRGTVFTVTNNKHSDAKVVVNDHKMYLCHGDEIFKTIKLGKAEDYDNSDFAQYELDIGSLVSYINRIGEGWIAFPFAGTNRLPHDIYDMDADCYNIYVNVEVDNVKGETYYAFYDGELPENYSEVGAYKGCAWLDMHFTVSDELTGNPNIDVVLKGRKVLDTRTGVVGYSTNPAMCLRDFLLNDIFGVGWHGGIDEDSFIEAADYCDETVTFEQDGALHTRKRYELNLILDQQEDAEQAVGKFLSACCGYLVRYRGIIGMRIEKPTPISYSFDENQIVKDSFAISQIGLDETPNRYILNIISPENNWRATRCIVEDTAMQEQLGVIQEESIDLDGVTSQQQALRIGRFYRDLNTVCNKVVSFSTASQAAHLQPGDVIRISYYKAVTNMPFRIISIKEEPNGTFHIEGREYCESIYTDELGAHIHSTNYTPAAAAGSNLTSSFVINEGDGGITYNFSNGYTAFNIPMAGYY